MSAESRLAARDHVVALTGYLDDHDGLNFLDALDDFERESRTDLLMLATYYETQIAEFADAMQIPFAGIASALRTIIDQRPSNAIDAATGDV